MSQCIDDLLNRFSLDSESRVFIDLTSVHTASLAVFSACLSSGASLICRSVESDILGIIQKYHVTHAFLLPQNLVRMQTSIQTPGDLSMPALKWRKFCLKAGRMNARQAVIRHKWTHSIIQSICVEPLKNKIFDELQAMISYGDHFDVKTAEFYSNLGMVIYNAYTTSEFGFVHLHQFSGKGGYLKSVDARIRNGILAVKSRRGCSYVSMNDLVFEDERCGICTRRNFTVTLSDGTVKNVDVSPMREILARNELIDEIFIFGQDKPYLTALIYLNEKALKVWGEQQKLEETLFEELSKNPKVYSHILGLVEQCGGRRWRRYGR